LIVAIFHQLVKLGSGDTASVGTHITVQGTLTDSIRNRTTRLLVIGRTGISRRILLGRVWAKVISDSLRSRQTQIITFIGTVVEAGPLLIAYNLIGSVGHTLIVPVVLIILVIEHIVHIILKRPNVAAGTAVVTPNAFGFLLALCHTVFVRAVGAVNGTRSRTRGRARSRTRRRTVGRTLRRAIGWLGTFLLVLIHHLLGTLRHTLVTAILPPVVGVGGIIVVEVNLHLALEAANVAARSAAFVPDILGHFGSKVDARVEVAVAAGFGKGDGGRWDRHDDGG
jgi:hypothetical protein